MSSVSGYVNYLSFTAGSNKGGVKHGDMFNSARGLGKVDQDYTGSRVVEAIGAEETAFRPAWTPVVGKVVLIKADGTEEEKELDAEGKVDIAAGTYAKAKYVYDNETIPQADLPILNAKMEGVPLVAKARRIAIYYSQMAAYQAKTDYGFDMGDELAAKAVGQLSYKQTIVA